MITNKNLTRTINLLRCPDCKGVLFEDESLLFCKSCVRKYAVKNGIPVFADVDEFYKGRFTKTVSWEVPQKIKKLPFAQRIWSAYCSIAIDRRKQKFFTGMFNESKGLVLDLGCGGGNLFFTSIGPVVGVDLSLCSLEKANRVYDLVVQADVTRLPFPDETFDYVVSSDLYGHIPLELKEAFISEIWRVLKFGGKTVHVAETDSENIFFRFAKKYPELFCRHFQEEIGGHFGLEMPTAVIQRFRKAGFKPIVEEKIYGSFWQIDEYVFRFDNEYRRHSKAINALVLFAKALSATLPTRALANCLIGITSSLVEPLFPLNNGQGLLVCYEKSKKKDVGENEG
jgi:ubiquinone/menaquinone biosynthesis C-methylase UbiE